VSLKNAIDSPKLRFFFVALVVAVSVAFVIPVPEVGAPGTDKTAHLVIFAIVGLLLMVAWSRLGWVVAVLIVVGYGFAIEIVQGILPWRSFEWLDLAADAAGGAAGVLVASLLGVRKRTKSS